jgi:hypothetical protein
MFSPGWIPVQFALGGQSRVHWLDFAKKRPSEPGFEDTVSAVRALAPVHETVTSIETFIEFASSLPSSCPAGIVYHISRCGSTLISNALRLADDAIIISEAIAVNNLLSPYLPNIGIAQTGQRISRTDLLKLLACLYASQFSSAPQKLILKLSSWNLLCAAMINSVWPATPIVAVIRNPVEVAVSQFADDHGWLSLKRRDPDQAARLFGCWSSSRIAAMSDAEFCARVIGLYLGLIEQMPGVSALVSYDDLSSETVLNVMRIFDLSCKSDCVQCSLSSVFARHSKNGLRQELFVNDGARKQTMATEELREYIHRYAAPSYDRLKRRATDAAQRKQGSAVASRS